MTEEILQAAIMKLKSQATERFGLMKDLYHRPATLQTVDLISQHAIAMAQLEGAAITLQQYSELLAKQTEDEAVSNEPVEVEVEEYDDESENEKTIGHDELMERSSEYRKSVKRQAMSKEDGDES